MVPNSLESSDVKRKRLLLAWLLLASFLVYANTLANGFVSDDHQQIEGNPYAHSFRYLGRVFTTTVWSFQGTEGQTNYYRPLMTLGYVVCDEIFQNYPLGFHLVNLFLNCLVVWLVFRLGERAIGDERVAFVAATLFAFHPAHSEAVAWIAAVTELELAVFGLLSFLLFLQLGEPNAGKAKTQALMWLTFLLALFSKEQAVTLPVLATLYEHLYRDDRRLTTWGQKISRYGPFWGLTGAYLCFRVFTLHGLAPVAQRPDLTVFQLVMSALALIGQYAVKLVWPHPLMAFYLFAKSPGFSDPRVLFGSFVAGGLLVLLGILWRYAHRYSFWLLWLGVTLAPVLNVRWMAASAFAERYLYLPSVGFSFLVAGGVVALWDRSRSATWVRAAAAACGVATVALASFAIVQRNSQWHDDERMMAVDLARQPHASYLRANIGAIEWSRHQKDEAVRQWRLALLDRPDNAIALCNLGMAMIDEKKWSEAEDFLNRAISARHGFASPHIYLGDLYLDQGRTADAETEYRRAIQIFPLNTDAHNRLGKFYLANGRLGQAEEQFRASLDASPSSEAWSGLGDLLLQESKREGAARAWRNVVELEPFDEHARLELGQIYQAEGRLADAAEQYRVVLLLDPQNGIALSGMRQIKPSEPPPLHP